MASQVDLFRIGSLGGPKAIVGQPVLGSYSKVNNRTQAWLATPVTSEPKTSTGKSRAKQGKITHPTFEAFAMNEADPEWVTRFNKYALGTMPRGISFKSVSNGLGGILTGKKGIKYIELKFHLI